MTHQILYHGTPLNSQTAVENGRLNKIKINNNQIQNFFQNSINRNYLELFIVRFNVDNLLSFMGSLLLGDHD
jgi:hypothetical protein